MAGLLTISNPLALNPGSSGGVVIGGAPQAGQSDAGSLISSTPQAVDSSSVSTSPITSSPTPSTSTTTPTAPAPPPSPGQTPAQQAAAATAAAQKQAQINAAINYGTSNAIAAGSAGTSEQAANLKSTGDQYQAAQEAGQNDINLARTQIGTTQINSIKQLQETIKNGLQGVGVQLGNSNALGSSAADAAARAYATYGNVQTNAANNTAATGNLAQDTAQNNLDITTKADLDQLNNARDAAIANIQGNAISALNNLGTLVSVYLQGDPSQINAPAIQQQIVSNAQGELSQVDQNYQSLIGGINPMSTQQIATGAEAASNAGVVPASGAPYNPVTAPSTSGAISQPYGGAPAPSLIPLTLGLPGSNQTQIPGA